jgi:hypothetical protein
VNLAGARLHAGSTVELSDCSRRAVARRGAASANAYNDHMVSVGRDPVRFQQEASLQGKTFETVVRHLLIAQGFAVAEDKVRLRQIGVEIDFAATSAGGTEVWIEAKGTLGRASGDKRPGLERTDTLKKAICNAALVATLPESERRPFIVITTHPPIDGSSGGNMLRTALAAGYMSDLIVFNVAEDHQRLATL